MNLTKFALKNRFVSSALVAVFVAGPFQAASCTINVDEETVQRLASLLDTVEISGTVQWDRSDDHHDGRHDHHGDDDWGDFHD